MCVWIIVFRAGSYFLHLWLKENDFSIYIVKMSAKKFDCSFRTVVKVNFIYFHF